MAFTGDEEPLFRRLAQYSPLEPDDLDALQAAVVRRRGVRAGEQLVSEGERPDHLNLVLHGYLGRYKTLNDGRRQATSLYVDGDVFDLRMYVLDTMDHAICALSDAEIAFLPRDALLKLSDARPRIARALWAATLVNESIMAEWLVNVGRRSAVESFAHLVCELYWRLRAVGAVQDGVIAFPFTQTDVAEMLALSSVHASRSMGRLRRDGLIRWGRRKLTILDLPALERLGGFDAGYLHLPPRT